MNIEHIRTFLDLTETRNFSRTAGRLDVNQSTVSFRIRALERALGARLFVRGRGATELTPAGLKFERYARSLRRAWGQALEDIGLPAGFADRLHLGMQIQLADRLADGWGLALERELPDTAIHIGSDYSKAMSEQLILGTLDIAVLYDPERRPELVVEPVFEEAFDMVATRPMRLQDVTPATYIGVRESPQFQERHAEALPELGQPALSVEIASMAVSCLRTRGGAAYLPRRLARPLLDRGEAALVPDAPTLGQTVHVAHHGRNRRRTPVLAALECLRSIDIDAPGRGDA